METCIAAAAPSCARILPATAADAPDISSVRWRSRYSCDLRRPAVQPFNSGITYRVTGPSDAGSRIGGDREHSQPVLAGQHHARRRDRRRRHHRDVLLEGKKLESGVVESEPFALVAEAFLFTQQWGDHTECFILTIGLHPRIGAKRPRVRGQRARAGTEHCPPTTHVVELNDLLGDVGRVVVRQDRRHRSSPVSPGR